MPAKLSIIPLLFCRWLAYTSKCVFWWEDTAYNIWRIEASTWEASFKGWLIYLLWTQYARDKFEPNHKFEL